MKGERAIHGYVMAETLVQKLLQRDATDISDYAYHVKTAKDAASTAYRKLNGGQIAEARRRLAKQTP